MKNNELKTRIGEEGEQVVYEAVVRAMKEIGLKGRPYRNVIIRFRSIYGDASGYLTAEYDLIVVSDGLIFLIEVKNTVFEKYSYTEPSWVTKFGERLESPINQNRNHKKIFCDAFGVPSDRVITVECLLKNERIYIGYQDRIPNDHVLCGRESLENLSLLFASKYAGDGEIDSERIRNSLAENEKNSPLQRDEHIENVDRVIRLRKKRKNGFRSLGRRNYCFCPECGELLVIVEKGLKAKEYVCECTRCTFSIIQEEKERIRWLRENVQEIKGDLFGEREKRTMTKYEDYQRLASIEEQYNRALMEKRKLERDLKEVKDDCDFWKRCYDSSKENEEYEKAQNKHMEEKMMHLEALYENIRKEKKALCDELEEYRNGGFLRKLFHIFF